MLFPALFSTIASASSVLVVAPMVASDAEKTIGFLMLILTFVKILMGLGA